MLFLAELCVKQWSTGASAAENHRVCLKNPLWVSLQNNFISRLRLSVLYILFLCLTLKYAWVQGSKLKIKSWFAFNSRGQWSKPFFFSQGFPLNIHTDENLCMITNNILEHIYKTMACFLAKSHPMGEDITNVTSIIAWGFVQPWFNLKVKTTLRCVFPERWSFQRGSNVLWSLYVHIVEPLYETITVNALGISLVRPTLISP